MPPETAFGFFNSGSLSEETAPATFFHPSDGAGSSGDSENYEFGELYPTNYCNPLQSDFKDSAPQWLTRIPNTAWVAMDIALKRNMMV